MKYNKKSIMNKAWELVKKFELTISKALKIAWANAKAILKAKMDANVTEDCHTWYGWKMIGKEVIHESVALFKVMVIDLKTKSGYRTLSYFGASQVTELGSQD